jgi:hypothetical protein
MKWNIATILNFEQDRIYSPDMATNDQTIILITGGQLPSLMLPHLPHQLEVHTHSNIPSNSANGGIGFELAAQLLADATNFVLLGSRSIEKGKTATQDLKARNLAGNVEMVQIDVDSEESVEAAAKEVGEKCGRYVNSLRHRDCKRPTIIIVSTHS